MSDILHSSISVLDMHKKASQLNSEPLLYGKQQMNHKPHYRRTSDVSWAAQFLWFHSLKVFSYIINQYYLITQY